MAGLKLGDFDELAVTGLRVGALEGLADGLFVCWTGLLDGRAVGLSVAGLVLGVFDGLVVLDLRVGVLEGVAVGSLLTEALEGCDIGGTVIAFVGGADG